MASQSIQSCSIINLQLRISWASEASPTLGHSIKILRDIIIAIYLYHVTSSVIYVIGRKVWVMGA